VTVERVSGPEGPSPVIVRTRFERFPLLIKGAFIVRGADGNPHAIQIEGATVSRIPGGPSRSIPTEGRPLDVAPNRDLFVPFDAALTELEPGWYEVRSAIRVDGGKPLAFSSLPFVMPWARTDVRRGTVPIGRTLQAGGKSFEVVRLEMQADAAVVAWRRHGAGEASPAGEAQLLADGQALEPLPEDAVPTPRSADATELRTAFYPMPRSARSAAIAIRLSSDQRTEPVEVPLG
jgi:hypothetical protein